MEIKLLEILGPEKSHLAPKFDTYGKYRALEILGPDKAELALKIGSYIKSCPSLWAASMVNTFYIQTYCPKNGYIYKALNLLKGSDNIWLALYFDGYGKIKALSILGPKKAALALMIGESIDRFGFSLEQESVLEALEILKEGELSPEECHEMISKFFKASKMAAIFNMFINRPCDIAEMASLFTSQLKVRALEIVGAENADLALTVARDISDKLELHYPAWVARAQEKIALDALKILKDSPNIKHASSFFNQTNAIKLLRKCDADTDCVANCIDEEHQDFSDLKSCLYEELQPAILSSDI